MSLFEDISSKKAKIGFVGLGKMGLPSALLFAEAGFKVIGIDVDGTLVRVLNKKQNPYFEPGLDELLKNNNFLASTNYAELRVCDVVLCAVPTSLKEKQPDYSIVEKAFLEIGRNMKKNSLVIFESNVNPGVTESLVKGAIEKNGFRHGKDYFLAYAPIQGKAGQMITDLKKYERVVAGLNKEASELAGELFKRVGNKVILASRIKVVELEKLFANIYKDINVAIANELAYYCEKQKIDVSEVIKYCNLLPGIRILEPSIGVGGNCLPVDPYFYLSHAKKLGVRGRLCEVSREINDSRPLHFARKIIDLAKKRKAKNICLLGAAFRKNTHETAYSPAVEIYRAVLKEFPETKLFDPVVGGARLEALGIKSAADPKGFDLAVILVDHSAFDGIKALRVSDL